MILPSVPRGGLSPVNWLSAHAEHNDDSTYADHDHDSVHADHVGDSIIMLTTKMIPYMLNTTLMITMILLVVMI